ncbi:MAG: NUDIX domain-containing protein, partial [Acidimicrobiia bacterium]
MALVRRPSDGALLVAAAPGDDFERPLGGRVEFGERAEDAVRREFLEEIGQPLGEVRLLAVVENLFRVGGIDGHEVVFLFHATLEDP